LRIKDYEDDGEMYMKVAHRTIGPSSPPFIIAEMSGNHNQSLDKALEIVEAAARAGAHALKLQTYTADTITLDISEGEFFINDEQSLWKGCSLHDLYNRASTPWEWHAPIIERARELGMICFSTPFDETAVDFLEELDVPAYKIASFENVHLPLIQKVAATGKPMFISTGMATLAELDEAVRTAREAGCRDLVLLKCTSTYPATPENSNILTIPHMRTLFNCEVGLSDHTMGIGAAVAAVAHGATVIEKHFTLDKTLPGNDHYHAGEPTDFAKAIRNFALITALEGQERREVLPCEEIPRREARRSLVLTRDVKAGEVLTARDLTAKRPGTGVPPRFADVVIGQTLSRDLPEDSVLDWHDF